MCEVGNLIDLTPDGESNNEEMKFKGSEDSNLSPYDPFESMEKEACAKGMALKSQIREDPSTDEAHYPDLNEGPLLKLNTPRPTADLFERIIVNKNQQMLSTESPLKLVEDDDLSSSLKFERDLRMLRIPFLDALSEAELSSSPEIHREDHKINNKTEANLAETEDQPKSRDMEKSLQQLRALIHQEVAKTKWHLFEAIIEPIAALISPGHDPDSSPRPSGRCPEAVEQREKSETEEALPVPATLAQTSAAASFHQRRNTFAAPSNLPTRIGLNRRSVLEGTKTPLTTETVVKSSGGTRTMIPTQRFLKPAAGRASYSTSFRLPSFSKKPDNG